ncbi:MAG: SIMPL domain-containing protein [Candidatus Eremiobacteraeota bacterium]|nr:SIMPL domain-containing protein [Candidatus Eremiobacteraeota bacterium]
MRNAVLVLSACVAFAGCNHQPAAYPIYHNANVNEAVDIDLGTVTRPVFVAALRSAVMNSSHDMRGGVNMYGGYGGPSQAVSLPGDAMTLALNDAQRKAALVAKQLHVELGPVESVTEQLSGAVPNGLKGAPAPPPPLNAVRSMAGQPLTLNVVYRVGSGDRFISVFGIGSSAGPQPYLGSPQTLRVNVNGTGASLAEATRSVAYYESLVREAAKNLGIQPAKITIGDGSFNAN